VEVFQGDAFIALLLEFGILPRIFLKCHFLHSEHNIYLLNFVLMVLEHRTMIGLSSGEKENYFVEKT
jgi:hypothetical protein